ncbi:putative phospholipase B-like lamina ancestor, partial [Diaphorina citri]|uniref:Phospholipase B-like n=1 Tax=Diaphorina citri TaxID=121845 RepID=A0A3Q0JFH8_DIACI
MLEGALSWQMIQHHWQNTIQKTCNGRQEFCARTRDYLRENMETVRKTAERFDTIDPFWHQVHLFYIQLEGIEVGWRSGIRRSRREYPSSSSAPSSFKSIETNNHEPKPLDQMLR